MSYYYLIYFVTKYFIHLRIANIVYETFLFSLLWFAVFYNRSNFKTVLGYFLKLHRGGRRICPRTQRKKRFRRTSEREMEKRRWALQFISVGLISVASRGLRLTFRWSFVRSSFRSMGERTGERGRWGDGRTRDLGRGSAFLRQHSGRPYRVPKRKTKPAQKVV